VPVLCCLGTQFREGPKIYRVGLYRAVSIGWMEPGRNQRLFLSHIQPNYGTVRRLIKFDGIYHDPYLL